MRYGIGILATIVGILLAGSALFSYPETLQVEVTLSPSNPPAYIKSTGNGKIERLYVANGQTVKKGDILAVMESVANTDDILRLRECLNDWQKKGARPERMDMVFFQQLPKLGSIQEQYASCMLAWNNYLQHAGENRIYETELKNATAQMMNALYEWERNFLPTAPIDGRIAFMQLWKKGQYVGADETMFVVVPDGKSEFVGKALLPMQGSGKVKAGQRAIIRLTGFPEQEYKGLKGKVVSISPVPDEKGNYIMEIQLTEMPEKLPPTMKVMSGTAEIIIREQSLLRRILNN